MRTRRRRGLGPCCQRERAVTGRAERGPGGRLGAHAAHAAGGPAGPGGVPRGAAPGPPRGGRVDIPAMRESFAKAAAHGDEAPLWFYSHLFLTHPETRDLFPVSMAHQRDRLFAALGDVVHYVDDVDRLVPMLQQLGRDHRKFGTVAAHYPAVGASLLATLEHFDDAWDDDLAKSWTEAYGLVADVMVEAAEKAAGEPPWWEADVVAHERRTVDVAVLRVVPREPFHHVPGQSLSLETALRP